MNLDEKEIAKIEEITGTDYGFNEKGETDNWDVLVEDLLTEYEDLLEEYNDYKERDLTNYDIDD